MGIKKTLTGLVCSALAATALQGTAEARPVADFSTSIGLRNTAFHEHGYDWHEGQVHSDTHIRLDMIGDQDAAHVEGDILAQGIRFGEALKLRTQKFTILGGKIYDESDKEQLQLLAGIDERTTATITGILDYGLGDHSFYFRDVLGNLKSYSVGPALGAILAEKTDISEKIYELVCSAASGRTEENIIKFPTDKVVYEKNINFKEVSVGGKVHLRKLVQREPTNSRPSFIGWMEYIAGLKLIGQFNGYKNFAVESELSQMYPIGTSTDMFWAATFGATLSGIKPEDISINGNRVYDWTIGGGFRF